MKYVYVRSMLDNQLTGPCVLNAHLVIYYMERAISSWGHVRLISLSELVLRERWKGAVKVLGRRRQGQGRRRPGQGQVKRERERG